MRVFSSRSSHGNYQVNKLNFIDIFMSGNLNKLRQTDVPLLRGNAIGSLSTSMRGIAVETVGGFRLSGES